MMWWQDFLWGAWNGFSAWVVLIVHAFGGWDQFPLFDVTRAGSWYDFGFLIGVGATGIGASGAGRRRR